MSLPARAPLSQGWKSLLKRVADILTVYGHGLLAFSVGNAFVGRFDLAVASAFSFGLAAYACYISLRQEA